MWFWILHKACNIKLGGISYPGANAFHEGDYLENYGAANNEPTSVSLEISYRDLLIDEFFQPG